MGLTKEQQRAKIREEKKQLGEFISVVKSKPLKIKKNKTKSPKTKNIKKIKKLKILPEYKKQYRQYLLSIEWAQLRIDLFKHRGYSCEKCGENKKLNVHHLTYENIFNEEPEDLIILCCKCHRLEHKK